MGGLYAWATLLRPLQPKGIRAASRLKLERFPAETSRGRFWRLDGVEIWGPMGQGRVQVEVSGAASKGTWEDPVTKELHDTRVTRQGLTAS
jgi:hypothetical protein